MVHPKKYLTPPHEVALQPCQLFVAVNSVSCVSGVFFRSNCFRAQESHTPAMPPCAEVEAPWSADEITTAMQSKFPSTLDLISSNDPSRYVRMIDLTNQLGSKVEAFNAANPQAPISLSGKAEFMNPGMSHKVCLRLVHECYPILDDGLLAGSYRKGHVTEGRSAW